MWVNEHFEVANTMSWLSEFVNENTLSTIISHDPVCVSHMPIELIDLETDDPKLVFHIPTVDPIAKALVDGAVVTVVVHGPQQYISPAIYSETGLPTFNFGVAEVTDTCRALTQEELSGHLERLMIQREAMFSTATGIAPWVLDDAAKARFDQLLPRVAGFELPLKLTRLKLKMGQNRGLADRRHTVNLLNAADGVQFRVSEVMNRLL